MTPSACGSVCQWTSWWWLPPIGPPLAMGWYFWSISLSLHNLQTYCSWTFGLASLKDALLRRCSWRVQLTQGRSQPKHLWQRQPIIIIPSIVALGSGWLLRSLDSPKSLPIFLEWLMWAEYEFYQTTFRDAWPWSQHGVDSLPTFDKRYWYCYNIMCFTRVSLDTPWQ